MGTVWKIVTVEEWTDHVYITSHDNPGRRVFAHEPMRSVMEHRMDIDGTRIPLARVYYLTHGEREYFIAVTEERIAP